MSKQTADVADFICSMAKEMAVMADSAELPFLGYLLQLVEAEARQVGEGQQSPGASTKNS